MTAPRWKSSHIQTLLFDARVWTPAQAVAWARSHGFSARKVHLTDHYVRVRQVDPTDGMPKRTFCLDRACHIKAILEAGPAPRASARSRSEGARGAGMRGLARDARQATQRAATAASRTRASGRARR